MFVFPSRTDTFGLVLLEAMASGVPVAAYPVTGPIDIVERGVSGFLDEDLGKAARAALTLDRAKVREDSFRFTWARTAELFLNNIGNVSASAAARVAAARTAPRSARARPCRSTSRRRPTDPREPTSPAERGASAAPGRLIVRYAAALAGSCGASALAGSDGLRDISPATLQLPAPLTK